MISHQLLQVNGPAEKSGLNELCLLTSQMKIPNSYLDSKGRR